MKIILLLHLMLLLVLGSHAQYSLRGKIIDAETNEALPGAHIIVQNTYLVHTSDENGSFIIQKLKEGN